METLNLEEAAEFLRINAEILRRKAHAGKIPGRKTGKSWLFIKEHLADWVSGRYPEPARPLQVIDGYKTQGENKCQSTNETKRGGYKSPRQTEDAYSNLLALKTNRRPKSCTTS
jgi:excisionase family DNA binding protein